MWTSAHLDVLRFKYDTLINMTGLPCISIPSKVKHYWFFMSLVVLSTAKACVPWGLERSVNQTEARNSRIYMRSLIKAQSPTQLIICCTFSRVFRREKWVSAVESLNFTHCGRDTWSLLRKLSNGMPSNGRDIPAIVNLLTDIACIIIIR